MQSALKRQKLVDLYLERNHPEITNSNPDLIKGLELCNELSLLPFWCGNTTLHEKKPNSYQDEKCCLTHTVGLPTHPATGEAMPLTPYQVKFVNHVIQATKAPTIQQFKKKFKAALRKYLKTPHFFHVNKGRQMGFTEILLRLIQYFSFSRYSGYNIGIMAGTNGSLARKDLRRFARLYKSIPIVVSQWIKNNVMKLVNGTIIESFSASEEAMTGDTKYKCVFLDEAAKWRLVDDTPVFNSVEPIIRAAGGDLFLVSTPKGPLKIFYRIHSAKKTEYDRLEYDIWECEGNLYSTEEILAMLASATSDPNQEYLCKFTIGEGSILGEVTDEDRDETLLSWEQELESEDDNYSEDNEDWGDIHET